MSAAGPAPAADGSRRSVSTLLGCGCAALITLFMLFVVVTTWLTYRAGERLKEMVHDPRAAEAATREVLPYDRLPAGYAPRGTLSVPLVMDVAFFGGPGASGGDDAFDHGFVYVRVRDWLGRGDRTREWLSGGEGDDTPIEQQQVAFQPKEVVARGELTTGGARITWSARRGDVEIDLGELGDGEEDDDGGDAVGDAAQPGVLALMAIDCGDEGWERIGMWFVPDPAPESDTGDVDWTGTPGDPRAIADFLTPFALCAGV